MPKFPTPLDQTFSALADPTRRAVLVRLAEGPASVTVLAAPFDMALPSFVQHIRVLEEGGLIVTEKTGRTRVCRIDPEAFGRVEGWIADQRRKWAAQTDRLQEFLEQGRDLADGPRHPEEKNDG